MLSVDLRRVTLNKANILEESYKKIKHYIEESNDPSRKVVEFKDPAELKEIIDTKINKNAVTEKEFLGLIDNYLDYSVKTSNKQFLNQLYSGLNFPAFIGEMFTALANASMYTYEVAPVATIVETEMIDLMNQYSGYVEGDGIFVSGGSNANLVAMLSARNKKFPKSRTEGVDSGMKLKVMINEQAHYSFETAANVLGIGADNVIKVKSDKNGAMIPEELDKAVLLSQSRKEQPFFVVATCGTTLLAAYDPIAEISKICKKHNIWLHADGSFGGSVLLSEKNRYLMRGIENTDSFAWNPHKLMNIPLICSALLVKDKGTLQKNITDINTDYIYHDSDSIEDLGKKSLQCGRKADAVKLWFAWKYFGLKGYESRIDNLIDMAMYAEKIVSSASNLELMSARNAFAVCFRYIPERRTDIDKFNLALRETMRKEGLSIVNYSYLGEQLVIRLIIANGELEKSDIDLFFENISATGKRLELKLV